MPNYQRMYTILVDVMERILEEVEGRVEPDDGFFLHMKEEFVRAMNQAEDVYIESSEEKEP